MMKLKKKKKICTTAAREEDRISDLPDSVLHHILSFLDMKQVVQTSLLSPRWRCLWKSIPVLNFDHSFWTTQRHIVGKNLTNPCAKHCYTRVNTPYKYTFMRFVSQVLELHDSCFTVNKFHLSASYYCSTNLIVQWVSTALQQGAQEIHLKIGNYRVHMELPHDLFLSPITMFKLQLQCPCSKLPDSICSATHLKTLHLEAARFPNGNSDGELVMSFPVLEDLTLLCCDHGQIDVLNISALQLTSLIIENGDISLVRSCKLKICTPRLASFQCKGLVYKDYLLENLSSLVNANLESRALMHRFEKKVHPQNLATILNGICNVETLKLSIQWTERFVQVEDVMDELPLRFDNLRCLKLMIWSYNSFLMIPNLLRSSASLETLTLEISERFVQVEDMMDELPLRFDNLRWLKLMIWSYNSFLMIPNLLRSSPSLETLILEISEDDISTTEKTGEELSLLYQLKFVEIHNFKGYRIEFELIETLLENAMSLERITITAEETMQEMLISEGMNLEDFKEHLDYLSRDSNVEILFPISQLIGE